MGGGGNSEIIQWFVLGSAVIMAIYHLILYLQHKDKYILLYTNYLFSLILYINLRVTTGYDTFTTDHSNLNFFWDEILILYMLLSYVLFITRALEITNKDGIVKFAENSFYVTFCILLVIHFYRFISGNSIMDARTYFVSTKFVLAFFAIVGLIGAIFVRKSTFKRIIIFGGFVYALFSLVTIVSVYFSISFVSLYHYDIYFIGCMLDVLIFSSALGHRSYLILQEKIDTEKLLNLENQKTTELIEEKNLILKKENERRELQAKMDKLVQDEVGASLSSIHVFADLAASVIETNPDKSREMLKRISTQGQQLMEDLGDMIWITQLPDRDRLNLFINKINSYGYDIFLDTEIVSVIHISPGFEDITLTNEFIKSRLDQIKIEMKELIKTEDKMNLVINFFAVDDQPRMRIE